MTLRRSRRVLSGLALAVIVPLAGLAACAQSVDGSAASASMRPAPSSPPAPRATHPITVAPSPAPAPTPAPSRADGIAGWVDDRLQSMTLTEKVQSLLMLHRPGTDASQLKAFAERYRPGGLILMGDNIPASIAALSTLTHATSPDSDLPLLFATDQEGGTVSRLAADTAPGADRLKSLPPEKTREAFESRGALLKKAGIPINFGVVADVTDNTSSFIYDRVLGTDPQAAAARVTAAVTGESDDVLSTLKHFPGHGAVTGDSHTMVPQTALSLAKWLTQDAPPFEAGIKAGAQLVMFGHLAYTSVDPAPATLSAAWHRILREQLGFTGITVTDDMLMLQASGQKKYRDPAENAIRALAAGNTMLLYVLPADPSEVGIDLDAMVDAIVTAVRTGRISETQIDSDARALLTLRRALAVDRS